VRCTPPRGNRLDTGCVPSLCRGIGFSRCSIIALRANPAELKKRGAVIGVNDLFIAAHASSLGLTLVTNNTREFARITHFALENWSG
jgi:predicted nucleic acid-binding protein